MHPYSTSFTARRSRSLLWLLLAAMAAVVLAAPAGARADAALTRDGDELRFDSDAQDAENLVISRQTADFQCAPVAAPCVQFANGPQEVRDQVAGDACAQVIATVVACTPTAAARIHLKLDDGDDFARVLDDVPPTTLDGGPGDDDLDSRAGADVLLGGPGDDRLQLGDGADDASGGEGTDTVELGGGDDTVRLDGLANDGTSGEGKNVRADVEIIDGGNGDDTLFGSPAANVLRGGPGDDRLDGGGGVDAYEGGAGDDTLLARDGLRERVDCGPGDDGGAADTIDALTGCETLRADSGLVPDADGDGAAKPADCDDENPAVRPGARDVPENGIDEDCSGADAVDLDRDGDGFLRPSDCDDADPAVNPGAVDRPGDATDQDCRDGAAPFPALGTAVAVTFRFAPRFTRFTAVKLRDLEAKSKVRVLCKGKGCPFRRSTSTVKRAKRSIKVAKKLRRAKLRPGVRVIVRVTKGGTVGTHTRFKVRAGKAPARRDRCLPPATKRPVRCVS